MELPPLAFAGLNIPALPWDLQWGSLGARGKEWLDSQISGSRHLPCPIWGSTKAAGVIFHKGVQLNYPRRKLYGFRGQSCTAMLDPNLLKEGSVTTTVCCSRRLKKRAIKTVSTLNNMECGKDRETHCFLPLPRLLFSWSSIQKT